MEFMRGWYLVLSRVSAALTGPVGGLADRVDVPVLSVILLGFIGAVAPCQLTTNLSAIAYVSNRLGKGRPWREALAYVLGKVIVYTMLGSAVLVFGLQLQAAAIPVAIGARKVLGPLMIVIGFGLLGLLRLRGWVGRGASAWLRARLPRRGAWGAFLLGMSFSLTFCPTLFWLFFGLMIPLALRSAGGLVFPGLFAVGTALPLLTFAGLLGIGSDAAGTVVERFKHHSRLVSRISGAIFILAGIHDTLTYWAL